MRLERPAADDVRGAQLRAIVAMWRRVWPRSSDAAVRDLFTRHSSRDGFQAVTAWVDEALAGLAYGYYGGAGQYWHDAVAKKLTRGQRERWLPRGFFELAELMVDPGFRRRGIGARLHDELLARVDAPTAALSTQVTNDAAIRLYESRGWVTVVPSMRFAAGEEPYRIMGLDLSPKYDSR